MKEFTLTIEPGRADEHYWRDLWHYRELFLILAWRDVAVRYKQTLIGVAWAVLRPFLTMVVFTVVFGKLAKLPSDGNAPYALMVFAGMLPWYLFSSALAGAAESMVANANLIGKVYFPRIIVPAASVVTALIDFLVSMVILVAVMLWYRFAPGWQILLLPRVHRPWRSSPASAPVSGLRRSTSNTAIFASWSRSSCNWACTFHRSVSAARSFPSSGASFTTSIRWSASSTGFAGASSVARVRSTGRDSC